MNSQRLLQLLTKSVLALVVMFALVATTASAQSTIYVSASSGNNLFDGSSANVQAGNVGPKRTIAAAITAAGAGGTIIIEAGTYAEDVTINDDLTVQTTASGANTTVTVGTGGGDAITFGNSAGDDVTLAGGGATITTTGTEGVDFQNGTVSIASGALTIPAGAPVTVTDAVISGSAPTFSGTNNAFTFDGTAAARTVGVEFPAISGLLTISGSKAVTFPSGATVAGITHSGGAANDVTFQGNVTSSALVTTTGAGDLTFDGSLTSTHAANPSVVADGGKLTAADVTVDNIGALRVGAGDSATISGTLTLQSDEDDADATRIDNDGTTSIGTVTLVNIDTDLEGAGSDTVVHTIANDTGSLTIGSLNEDSDSNSNAGAVAGNTVNAHFALTNATATGKTSFTNSVTISNDVTNSVATTNGVHFNGGGTIKGDVNNTGTITIASGTTLELTSDTGPFTAISDINGSGTLLISGDADVPATGIDADGNVTVSGKSANGGAATVDGNYTISSTSASVAGNVTVGGNMSITGDGSDVGGTTTVTGNLTVTADDVDFGGNVTVSGNVTLDANGAGAGPTVTGNLAATSGLVTISDDVTVSGNFTAKNATVDGNEDLSLTSTGAAHKVTETLNINGTSSVTLAAGVGAADDNTIEGSRLEVQTVNVEQNATLTVGVENELLATGNVTGGKIVATGQDSQVRFNLPSGGATFAPGPNTQITNFKVEGNERTLTVSQSFEVQDNLFVADDATMDLTNKLVRMTAAQDATGLVEIATDAKINASNASGAISFEGPAGTPTFTISSDVAGQAIGTLTNLVVAGSGAATNYVLVDESVTVTGLVTLNAGGITVEAGDTMTFSGDNAGISRNVAGANTALTGTTAGKYDLWYTGNAAGGVTAGGEYTGTNRIDDLTVNTFGGTLTFTPAVTVGGNFTVKESATVSLTGAMTVNGNMNVQATDVNDGTVAGAGGVVLAGADKSHTVAGTMTTPLTVNANATITGDTDNDRESNITDLTVNAGKTATITNLQEILGNVIVNGTLNLALVDADGALADDQDIEGTVTVDESGTLKLDSNVTVAGASTIGNDGAAGGVASLNMNGNRYTADGTFTSDADASLGSDGTLEVNANFGTNGARVPNLNIDTAAIAMTSNVDVTNLDVDEDFSMATFLLEIWGDGTFTSAVTPTAITGTGTFSTRGTTLTMSQDVEVPNFTMNSASTTTLASNNTTKRSFVVSKGGAGTGTVRLDAGELALGGQRFVLEDSDGAAEAVIDYNGGSVTGSGDFVVSDDDDDNGGVDLDTGNASFSISNLTVNIAGGATADANDGLDIGASDAVSVTGVLSLTGGTIFTDNGTNDATLTVADNALIVRNKGVLEQVPTFGGTGIDVEYDAAVTTANELPSTFDELQFDAAAILKDGTAITVNSIDANAVGFEIDKNDDNDNSITVTDGGTVNVSVTAPFLAASADDGELKYAGAFNIVYDGPVTTDAVVWNGTPASVTVDDGAATARTVTLHASRTAGNVTISSTESLVMGNFNLTVNGNLTQNGAITAGTGTLSFSGSSAQTYTVPTGGNTLPNVTFNNAAGVDISGGNLNVSTLATFTSGAVRTGSSNALVLDHKSTGAQGFTQTSGGVVGNVRKVIIGAAAAGAAADRMTFPTATADGTYRPVSITFNQPNQIGAPVAYTGQPTGFVNATGISLTVSHVESSPGGNNNLPRTTVDNLGNDLTIARYPSFHWLITSNNTLSPSVDYDLELNAAGFSAFDGEDIERTRTIRRQGGATTNFWFLVGGGVAANNDNYANSSTNPVTVVRDAVGAINAGNGVLFTMGLESNMTVTNPAAVSVNAGATSDVDLSTVFGGGTGAYSYTVTSGDAAVATGATAGNTLTVTGAAAGSTTLTVVATDELNDTRTATVSVTVNPALAASAIDAVELNAGGTSTVDLSAVFSGGDDPVTYAVSSDDAAVATGAEASGTLTITAVAAGSATITVVGTDATSQTATATVAVTVNAAMSATSPAAISLTEGGTQDFDLTAIFAGGNGTNTYAVSSASDANATGAVSGTTLTVTAVDAYSAGTTIATVDVTVTATDGLGSSVSATITVDVLPVTGDLDGSGAPSAASASIALDYFLGLNTTLTAKQIAAADFNGDSVVNAYDAALIFNAALNGKDEVAPNVAANLQFGAIQHAEGMVNIPVQIAGDLSNVVAASFTANIDPAKAKVVAVTSELDGEWIVKHTVSEEGELRIAVAGIGLIPTEGTIATISVQLTDAGAAFDLVAEGAVNNNSTSTLDAVEVVELPDTFTLQGNYPNPFNPTTTIQFDLPESADVEVQVFDMVGRVVMTLPAQNIAAGTNRSVQLNASQLASGSYFYRVIARMDSKTFVETGRMLLLK